MIRPQVTRRRLLACVTAATTLPLSRLFAAEHKTVRYWRHYVGRPGQQVHVRSSAPRDGRHETQVPLVCFHPSSYSGAFFTEFQTLLASDRWVLCPDTPGYGSSDPPPDKPTIADYAATFAQTLDALGFGRGGRGALDALGFHTGTLIAAELAVIRPDLVRRLVLPGVPFSEGEEQKAEYDENAREKSYFTDPAALGKLWSERHDWLGEDTGTERLLELLGEEIRAGRNNWWAYHAVFRYPVRERFSKVSQPTLVIATDGELKGPSEASATLLPKGKLVTFPQYRAPLFHRHTREMADATRNFLDAKL